MAGIFIIGGFAVALISVLVALILALHMEVSHYPDIALMCGVLIEEDSACLAGAISSGYVMLAGMAISLFLALAYGRKYTAMPSKLPENRTAFILCLVSVVLLLAAHHLSDFFGEVHISRIAEITSQSRFISLENLIWPLLLQLMNSSKDKKYKYLYISLLLPIISLSPYRGVIVAVFIFGLALPLADYVRANMQSWKKNKGRGRLLIWGGGLVLLTSTIMAVTLYNDTNKRNLSTAGSQIEQMDASNKLTQRLTYPLFQAYFAGKIAEHEKLPTMWNEVMVKLRLGDGPNLNEHLYSKVYGQGTVGEMTSLLSGEAAANSSSHQLIWIVVGPLLLVMLWILLRNLGYEVGTLVGIAIWRGSLGGVATVLPALIIQILFVLALSSVKKSK